MTAACDDLGPFMLYGIRFTEYPYDLALEVAMDAARETWQPSWRIDKAAKRIADAL